MDNLGGGGFDDLTFTKICLQPIEVFSVWYTFLSNVDEVGCACIRIQYSDVCSSSIISADNWAGCSPSPLLSSNYIDS